MATPKRVTFSQDDPNRSPRIPARGAATKFRCFDGLTRRSSNWDGWKKDHELWFPDGNCMVYFGAQGSAQQRPSLRVPLNAVESLQCSFLLEHCLHARESKCTSGTEDSADDSGYSSSPSDSSTKRTWDLYVPAPSHVSRDDATKYHLTTRNLLAYAVSRAIVGERLSVALLDLWHRLQQWSSCSTLRADFTRYLEAQGYSNFAENAEHALAVLRFAQEARLEDVWINAFAHCVGMHDRLDMSPEYAGLDRNTCALITRTSLKMDVYVSRTTRSLSGFLDDELGAGYLGLSKVARDHLDRFRSFLHAFYVDKHGYFPPSPDDPWDKRLWTFIRRDFQSLYDHLADPSSSGDLAAKQSLNGGMCVLQNIKVFDTRWGLTPLPYPLPLLPEAPELRRRDSGQARGVRPFRRRRSAIFNQPDTATSVNTGLAVEQQPESERVQSPLVQEYQRFERQKLIEKLDLTEARKVRWMLVYTTLQMLNSITKPSPGIRMIDGVSYPLCIPTDGLPPWRTELVEAESKDKAASSVPTLAIDTSVATTPPDQIEVTPSSSIIPDCEAKTAKDFFANHDAISTVSRQSSKASVTKQATSLRRRASLPRANSLRSSVQASVQSISRSVVGSLTRRNSSRRQNEQSEPASQPASARQQEDSGTHVERSEPSAEQAVYSNSHITPVIMEESDASLGFDFDLGSVNNEPILESHQLEMQQDQYRLENGPAQILPSASIASRTESNYPSTFSVKPPTETIPMSRASSRASSNSRYWDAPSNKREYLRLVPESPTADSYSNEAPFHQTTSTPSLRSSSSRTPRVIVHDGYYVPTGLPTVHRREEFTSPPPTRPALANTRKSTNGSNSSSSSYPDEPLQADDIEEDELRGRLMVRTWDRGRLRGGLLGGLVTV